MRADATRPPASPNRTALIHRLSGSAASRPQAAAWSVSQPVFQTTSWAYATVERAAESCAATHPEDCYGRYGNPNFRVVEEAIRDLEGAEAALAVGSGMGAVSLVLLSMLEPGDHVVAQKTHYAATSHAFRHWLPRLGIEVSQVDQTDTGAFEDAIRPTTRLLFLESPANPTLQLTDLAALGDLGRARGIRTCIDGTLATPVNQRPLDLGIDLVVHSATKYLGGHSDVTAGLVAGPQELIDRLWDALLVFGMVLHPFEAWLLARGLQTLPLRMPLHNDNALALARFLEGHERVARVHYPGLESHPQHALALRQMSGAGGLLSFEVAGDYELARRVVQRLELAQRAVSLGGTKTLAVHTASMIYPHVSQETRQTAGVGETLIRVAVGIEDAADIVEDFARALADS